MPSRPKKYYAKRGWKGWEDFLGYNRGTLLKSNISKRYRAFEKARSFARRKKFSSISEWRKFCVGKAKKLKKPRDIPSWPNLVYSEKGWLGWPDFLGIGPKKMG